MGSSQAIPQDEPCGRRWWRRVPLLIIALAVVFPAVARAYWSQYYVSHKYVNQGGINLSGFNNDINYNEVNWQDECGGCTAYGLTLCDASYDCYAYDYDWGGFNGDSRTISYGRAKCYYPNSGSVWVFYCWTCNNCH